MASKASERQTSTRGHEHAHPTPNQNPTTSPQPEAPANRGYWLAVLVVLIVHLALYFLVAYPALPKVVPTHWNIHGTIDGWGNKSSNLFLALVAPMMALLFAAASKVDPKRHQFARFNTIYLSLGTLVIVFSIAFCWFATASSLGVIPTQIPLVNPFILLFLTLLMFGLAWGMPRVEPNYTFGIRTPWTLANEHIWRETHRAARLPFSIAGLVCVVCACTSLVWSAPSVIAALIALVGASLWVCVYSYLLWRKSTK